MKIWKGIVRLLFALAAALAASVAMGTWELPGESDLIASWQGFRLTASGIGAGLSLLVLLGFAEAWITARRKTSPEEDGIGRVWNGIGFGLLPAVLIWKIFEAQTSRGGGDAAPGEIPGAGWLLREGRWLPAQAEALLAAGLLIAVILWLVLRKEPIPENGDLMGISLGCYAAGRMLTEGFRAGQESRWFGGLAGWIAAAVMICALAVWIARAVRAKENTGYALACAPVMLAAVAGTVLIQNGILRTGNPWADLGMEAVCSLLAMKSLCCMGRVTRKGQLRRDM